jgi:hypothetical protein
VNGITKDVALVSAATANNGEDLNEQLLGFFPSRPNSELLEPAAQGETYHSGQQAVVFNMANSE